jgi:hypothetical protein
MAFFFLPRQSAFDAARMNRHTEAFADRLGYRVETKCRIFCSSLGYEVQHLGCEFVRMPGAALLWK